MPGKRERGGKPKSLRIQELRLTKGWVTPEDLARHARREDGTCLDVKTVTEMETKPHKKKDWASLKAVAAALGVDVGEIAEVPVPGVADRVPSGGHLSAVTPVSDFVGRVREQADILDHLKMGGRVCISAIKAAGGVGKTQLAAKCVEQLRAHFDPVLWLRLDGMTTPKSSASLLQEVIRFFRPTDKLQETVAELMPQYLNVLHGRRALVVLDNAKDLAQVKPLFDPAVPNTVAFLVTSRNRIVITGDTRSINLELLSEPDAVALMRGIVNTPARGTDDEWKAVAKLCGRLPLALRIAGTFLRDKANWSLERYITALRTEPLRRLDLGTDDENVGRVLTLSVRQLVADNAERAERFQMLSVFPDSFDEDAAAAVWEFDPDDTFSELAELTDRSLVEFDETESRYRLHDLMRPVARQAFEVEKANPPPANSCGVDDLPPNGGRCKSRLLHLHHVHVRPAVAVRHERQLLAVRRPAR